MVDQFVGKRVHGPGRDWHVDKRERKHAHRVQHGKVGNARIVTQQGKCEREDCKADGADDAQDARAVLVEQPSGDRAHSAHDDSARKDDEA